MPKSRGGSRSRGGRSGGGRSGGQSGGSNVANVVSNTKKKTPTPPIPPGSGLPGGSRAPAIPTAVMPLGTSYTSRGGQTVYTPSNPRGSFDLPYGPGGQGDPLYGPGGGGGGMGGDAIGINTLPPMSDEDYLAGDSQYQAQLAALMKALQDSTADFEAQKSRYQTSYDDSIRSLGWSAPVADNPATPVNEAREGAWNRNDLNTASGRSFQNQLNDFASRGLLQSSAYGRSQEDLFRSLNDQLGGMGTARTGFMDDIARQLSAYKNQNTVEQQNARAEALARRAAGM